MKMSNMFLFAASLCALATSVQAVTHDWYLSFEVGSESPDSNVGNDGTNGAGLPTFELNSDTRFGLSAGKNFTPVFQVELEHTRASFDTDTGRLSGSDARATDEFGVDANVDSTTLMINAIYNFQNQSNWTPYVKAGIGYHFYDIDGGLYVGSFMGNTGEVFPGLALPDTFAYEGDGSEFAYNLGFGVNYNFYAQRKVALEYRFADYGQAVSDPDAAGDRLATDLEAQGVYLSYSYSF